MKRLLDILLSLALIIFLFPVFILVSFSICLTSPGPILFLQKRIGLRGKVFWMFKFRSMVPNAENADSGLFSFEADPRITRVGHLLRRCSLDELPQLFNVLFGSMSLVGPRPPVIYELGPWDEYTPFMLKRFTVKPGITGLAQISGRNDLNWDEKIKYDNIYVDRFAAYNILEDILILFKTIKVVFSRNNVIEKDFPIISSDNSPISAKARLFGRSRNPN